MLQTDLKAIAVGRLNIKVYRRRKEFIFKKNQKAKPYRARRKIMLGKQFNISYRVSAKRRKYLRIVCRDFRIGTEDGCEKSRIQKHTFFILLFFCTFCFFLPEKSKKHYKENHK